MNHHGKRRGRKRTAATSSEIPVPATQKGVCGPLGRNLFPPQAVEVLCHEWAPAPAWNYSLGRLGVVTCSCAAICGVIHLIKETRTLGRQGFHRHLKVLEQSRGTFTGVVPVKFVKDGCDGVDDLAVGDEIEVPCRPSGRGDHGR